MFKTQSCLVSLNGHQTVQSVLNYSSQEADHKMLQCVRKLRICMFECRWSFWRINLEQYNGYILRAPNLFAAFTCSAWNILMYLNVWKIGVHFLHKSPRFVWMHSNTNIQALCLQQGTKVPSAVVTEKQEEKLSHLPLQPLPHAGFLSYLRKVSIHE